MLKLSFTLFSLILLSNCNNNPVNSDKSKAISFIKVFEGTISDKYPLTMKLISDNNKLSGSFFYNKNGEFISITGNIINDSIFINGYDNQNNHIDVFKGIIQNGKLSGLWEKPNGKNKTHFSLIESSLLFPEKEKLIKKNVIPTYSVIQVAGIYFTPHYAVRQIEIKSDGRFAFNEGDEAVWLIGSWQFLSTKNKSIKLTFNNGTIKTLNIDGATKNDPNNLYLKGDGEYFVKK